MDPTPLVAVDAVRGKYEEAQRYGILEAWWSFQATSDAERLDEQLARIEIVGLSMGGEVAACVLEAALARFSPSEEELTSLLQVQPHVSASIARSLARALLDFQSESYEEATTVAMPKIESLMRELLRERGVLRFRPEREQRQGPSTRGQFPQLGALLGQIKPWLDQSWYRFLWTFLVSPFGPNYRNELLHGFTEDVTRIPAAANDSGWSTTCRGAPQL